jgi:hypothetical protein
LGYPLKFKRLVDLILSAIGVECNTTGFRENQAAVLNIDHKLKKLFELSVGYVFLLAFVKYSKQVNSILNDFETRNNPGSARFTFSLTGNGQSNFEAIIPKRDALGWVFFDRIQKQ